MTKIAIVGEAWGEEEEKQRMPFVGASGWHLTKMLEEAGINRHECFLTNTFNLHPVKNDLDTLCVPKKDDRLGLPPLKTGKYLHHQYAGELTRLYNELSQVRPNIILALGNTACWALLLNTGISKIRGTVSATIKPPGIKCLPAYHPAAVLRDWSLRPVTILDFMKAKRQSEFPEIRRPKRYVYTEPDLQTLYSWAEEFIPGAPYLSLDIETKGQLIDCIGFATSRDNAICVPFMDLRKPDGNYWPTAQDELAALDFVARLCATKLKKVGQNLLFDLNFIWRHWGITVDVSMGFEDTMLMHHALHPESPKGLGFLGSVYTDEPAWKTMRPRGKSTIKRDD